MKKKTKHILAISALALFLTPFLSSCLKTKNCNIEISEEEKTWIPYDDSQLAVFQSDSGNYDSITFSGMYNYADGEISEDNTCQASSYIFMRTTNNSGQRYDIGRYLIYKRENGGAPLTQAAITFVDMEFYLNSLDDETLLVSATSNPLETLDSLAVGDTLFRNVYHISAQDTAALSYSQLKDVYFSEDFRLVRYDIRSSQEIFELIHLDDNQ